MKQMQPYKINKILMGPSDDEEIVEINNDEKKTNWWNP